MQNLISQKRAVRHVSNYQKMKESNRKKLQQTLLRRLHIYFQRGRRIKFCLTTVTSFDLDGLDDEGKAIGDMDDVPEGMLSPTGSSTGEKLGFPDAGGMLGDPTTPTMLEKRKQKRQRMGMGKASFTLKNCDWESDVANWAM